MSKITKIQAREILDSRGIPTVEADVFVDGSIIPAGRASVPSGASVGMFEALERRDGNLSAYNGKGITNVVSDIEELIQGELIGCIVEDQKGIDKVMIDIDGTKNKSRIGANGILPVSLAVAKAAAFVKSVPLYKHIAEIHGGAECAMPTPMINVINGGMHASNGLVLQEFMMTPIGDCSFRENLRKSAEVFANLRKVIQQKGHTTNVGDEGGFAPNIESEEEALDFIIDAIESSGYKLGEDFVLALDAAASTFFHGDSNSYSIAKRDMSIEDIIEYYRVLVEKYQISSIEDPLDESDYKGWSMMTEKFEGSDLQIVGDDLFVTNTEMLQRGINEGMANAILIKPNQIGTLTETIETIKLAQRNNYKTIVSHRSGETEDVTIAHIAVGTGAGQIKTGSLSRCDRTAKYNELLRIEEVL